MGNYSYDKKRFLRIQRQSLELIIPLAYEYVSFQARYRSAGASEPVPRLGPRFCGPGPHTESAVGLCPLRGDKRADVQALGRLGLRGGLPRRIGQARTTERPLSAPADVAYLCVEVAGTIAPAEVCLMNFVTL